MTRVANDLMERINEIERDVYDGIDVKEGFADAYCMVNDLGTYVERLDAENASLHIRIQSAYATIERQKLSILNQRRQLAATQKALEERNAGVMKSRWRRSLAMWEERCASMQDENKRLRKSVRDLLTCIKHEECEESCPHYSTAYNTYGHDSHGSVVVEDEYLGCCLAGLENCNSTFFDTDEYLRELGIGEEQ